MSSESIVTALFLISAVIAAGVLISAIFPAIYRTADTFGSVSHESDVQMRTDIKIVNYYYISSGNTGKIWLKNVGDYRIGTLELDESDIFIGKPESFHRFPLLGNYPSDENTDIFSNNFWDQGETLTIVIDDLIPSEDLPVEGGDVYFAIVLPNGVRRSIEFVAD